MGKKPMQPFAERLRQLGQGLRKRKIDVLQVNMGKYCNQACVHCHVEASPFRTEMMTRETVEAVLHFLERSAIPTMDITGGAPELNPHFDALVDACVRLQRHVVDRCNLTVFFEPGKDYLGARQRLSGGISAAAPRRADVLAALLYRGQRRSPAWQGDL
jgi:hypothetical protein